MGHVRGEIELDGKVLVVRRIHVDYGGLQIPPERQEAADRVLATHQQACPVARSIEGAIVVTTGWASDR